MSSIVIRRAQVLRPNGEWMVGDVRIEDDKIVEVAPQITTAADRTIEAQGLTLLPGVIDPQVHFREPGLEYKEDLYTASRACARGGVTSFLEMPNTKPLTITQAALDDKLARAADQLPRQLRFLHRCHQGATARHAYRKPGLRHQNLHGFDAWRFAGG